MVNNKISKEELIAQVIKLNITLSRRPKKRDNSSLNYHAKKKFGSWNKLMQEAGFKVKFYQNINKIEFNEDFAYFLGLVITDGHIVYDRNKGKYKVGLYTSYPEEKEMLLKFIRFLFDYDAGVSSRMYGFNKRPNYEIRIASKNLVEFLVNKFEIFAGAKSLKVKVPKIIINSDDKRIKGAFLRGVIDGDGSILKKSIKIASGSKKFLLDIKKLLATMEINSSNVIRDNRITNTFAIRIGSRVMKKLYELLYFSKDTYHYPRKRMLWKTNIFK